MRSIVLLLLLALCFRASAEPYRNLVFEGGGIRGIAYTGALAVLEQNGKLNGIQQVAGTSVGAIIALLYSVGYSADEMTKIMTELNIQSFNDGQWFFIGGQKRFRKNYGWYRGVAIEQWLDKMIAAKTGNTDLTFKELHELVLKNGHYKDLFVAATNLSKQCKVVFSFYNYPDMKLSTAVRASISIPLYYGAVFLNPAGKQVSRRSKQPFDVFVDGGIVANYPIGVFDTNGVANPATLGLKLERPDQIKNGADSIAAYPVKGLNSYIGALYNLTIETLNRNQSPLEENGRTIYISTDNIKPRVRRISKEDKFLLYRNGWDAATRFLQNAHP